MFRKVSKGCFLKKPPETSHNFPKHLGTFHIYIGQNKEKLQTNYFFTEIFTDPILLGSSILTNDFPDGWNPIFL